MATRPAQTHRHLLRQEQIGLEHGVHRRQDDRGVADTALVVTTQQVAAANHRVQLHCGARQRRHRRRGGHVAWVGVGGGASWRHHTTATSTGVGVRARATRRVATAGSIVAVGRWHQVADRWVTSGVATVALEGIEGQALGVLVGTAWEPQLEHGPHPCAVVRPHRIHIHHLG